MCEEFKTKQSQLVQLPTGSGKTVILWHYLKKTKQKALIVAPTRELTEQIYETGCEVVKPKDVYLKKKSYIPKEKKHIISTMQGITWLVKNDKGNDLDFDVLIIDEAHRSQAKSYKEFYDKYVRGTDRKCIGLTATPERMDGKNLLEVFDGLTYKKSLIELINQKHLTDIECFRVKTGVEMANVKYFGGDYSPTSLKQLDTPKRNAIILDVVKKSCQSKKVIIFCVSVLHAEAVASLLREEGFVAASIDGKKSMKQRGEILDRFKKGDIEILCNCQLLTEGFDEPSIDAVILARPTKSKALYCQMVGRGLRPHNGKTHCYLYDLTDENHDITTFNALGGIPKEFNAFGEGFSSKLSEAVEEFENRYGDIETLDYELYKKQLYEGKEPAKQDPFDNLVAFEYQKTMLEFFGIPYFDDDITFKEAAFLLWKNRELRKRGYDTRKEWKGWGVSISGNNKNKRNDPDKCDICRQDDSRAMGVLQREHTA